MGGAVGLFVLAESRFGRLALEAAKERDRRYFLASQRAARACNVELELTHSRGQVAVFRGNVSQSSSSVSHCWCMRLYF